MSTFIAMMSYELSKDTEADARKMLRAELVGRRWDDKCKGLPMPAGTVWMRRGAPPGYGVDRLYEDCDTELKEAVAAVQARGLRIALVRGFAFVSGAGTCGLLPR